MDLSAKNLDQFEKDHWLSNPNNCTLLRLTEPAWMAPASPRAPPISQETARERLVACSARDLRELLEAQDMHGPASHLFSQSVNGADLLALTEKELVDEVRVTPFVAKKLLKAREKFLEVAWPIV